MSMWDIFKRKNKGKNKEEAIAEEKTASIEQPMDEQDSSMRCDGELQTPEECPCDSTSECSPMDTHDLPGDEAEKDLPNELTVPQITEEVETKPNTTTERNAEPLNTEDSSASIQQEKPAKPDKPAKQGFFSKLKDGLRKTRDTLLGSLFVENGEKIDDEFYEELEEAMIISDMGMTTTEKLLTQLRKELKANGIHTRTEARKVMIQLLSETMRPDDEFLSDVDKAVIMIVGVNGVGKTTSIGKLASMYKADGKSVMLAAADTFRAAAAEQLTIWAERADVPIVKHGEGADPAAVVFDSIASFKAKNSDILICDTAGRLHNKVNLMNELSKMRRVIDRELPGIPVEVLLVLDATTGQNAIAQAKVFGENAGLTGIILTKLDGTAKGGVVVAVKDELHLPVRFIGIGEGIDDLQPFDADAFAQALI